MGFIEENEVSILASGGTEITKRILQSAVKGDLDQFQIIPSRVRELDESKVRIYVQHDLPDDPEVSHLKNADSRNRFHKIVFSSNWQLNDFIGRLGIPQDEKVEVIETPIIPFTYTEKPKDKINIVYFSTPQRGLELVVPAVEVLAQRYDNIHLHVFSSFKMYGWENADTPFEPLFEKINQHPNMTYYGYTNNEVLREVIQQSHILAYPSIWKETSCRVLMESMSAGLFCVHPNLAALSDTSGGLTGMYQFNDDKQKHFEVFLSYLDRSINIIHNDDTILYLKFVKAYADARFGIQKISLRWESLLNNLLEKYPTVESRKIPGKMFMYKTG